MAETPRAERDGGHAAEPALAVRVRAEHALNKQLRLEGSCAEDLGGQGLGSKGLAARAWRQGLDEVAGP